MAIEFLVGVDDLDRNLTGGGEPLLIPTKRRKLEIVPSLPLL